VPDPSTEQRLHQFADLVARWSAKINLVSKHDVLLLWERHVQDSLRLVEHIPANTPFAIDLGSGAGFPGMVLAIATGLPFTLIESDKRKAAFLMDAARECAAPVKVLAVRIEDAKTPPAPLITARALAPLDKLLGLAAPHLAPDGICLFPKGKNLDSELAAATPLWHMKTERFAATGDADACILKVSQLRHVGKKRGISAPP
jgi:16S rRNA (guanine527-N7)-methyltransferase